MVTLSLLQAAATPAWVGPTMAISLAVIALSVLGMAIVVGSVGAPARRRTGNELPRSSTPCRRTRSRRSSRRAG